MLKLRYYLRLTWAFINRLKLLFIGGIVIGLVVFLGLAILLPHFFEKTQNIAVIGEYTTDNIPGSITALIGSGLTKLDTTGAIQPAIAKSFESTDSGKTWTFHLQENLKWQDGSLLTSRDINYNFSDVKVTKPDKYTIIFKLNDALALFPADLTKTVFKKGLLGTGEWKVINLTLAGNFVDTLTLADKDSRMVFKFYPTEERAKLAFELGEVTKIENLTSPRPFDTWKTVNLQDVVNKQRFVAVFFNNSFDFLADKDVRQALSYGIDKSKWENIRALGPISPNSWAYNPTIKPYDFDIAHAKELIAGSKISPDQKGNLKITLTTPPDLIDVANQIVADWKQIGVTTTLQITSFIPDQYQAFLGTYDIPQDPDQYFTWHSTQTQTNITHYKNPRIDKLLEDGRLETDEAKRKAIYFDFQKFLLEDAPVAFLYYPTYYNVSKK